MPTSKEKRVETYAASGDLPAIQKLGIIGGSGKLPKRLMEACEDKGIEPFLVAFEDQTDPSLTRQCNHMWARLGGAGQIIKTLKAHNIRDLVLVGGLRRPSLSELRPDFKTLEFFSKMGIQALGDNGFLIQIRSFLEKEGFRIHGVHKFVEDLLVQEGALGQTKPKKADWADIERGLQISQSLGALDIGQSVIVQEGIVLGVEAAEGTDELIARCQHLKRKGRRGVLVKTCKPNQDHDFDLPTIGPDTVVNVAAAGFGGIVVHARLTLMIEPDEMISLANDHKVFIYGADPKQYTSDMSSNRP